MNDKEAFEEFYDEQERKGKYTYYNEFGIIEIKMPDEKDRMKKSLKEAFEAGIRYEEKRQNEVNDRIYDWM